jgi:transporter family-2 protein
MNGGLAGQYGLYSATVLIHIFGLLFISILLSIKREKPFSKKYPWTFYLGGAWGVLIILFASYAFGRISVSAILALGLLGQSVAGLIIDQFGILGMTKHPFKKHKIGGLLLILIGALSMIDTFQWWAVILAFAGGVVVVISRTINAKLATLTTMYTSAFYNYAVGLVVSIFAFLLLGGGESIYPYFGFSPLSSSWYIYLGGVIGVAVVLLSNITVVKVSAFYLTLLMFIGQVTSGVIIDFILLQEVSLRLLIGAIFVTIGLSANLFIDMKKLIS